MPIKPASLYINQEGGYLRNALNLRLIDKEGNYLSL